MEDEENKPSFHGRLSQFAYKLSSSPPVSSSSSPSLSSSVSPPQALHRTSDGAVPIPSLLLRKPTDSRSPKRQKKRMGYAAPEVYAHLNGLPDYVSENLDVLFCGINPGHMSAVQGHHYANPTNHFWRCLHLSGFTPRLLLPSEDSTLPEKYNLGLTNLVERPSTSEAELSSQEMASSVPALLARVARLYPRIICFVGKGIWLHVERAFVLSKSKSKTGGDPGLGGDFTAETAETRVTPSKGKPGHYHLVSGSMSVSADARLLQPDPVVVSSGGRVDSVTKLDSGSGDDIGHNNDDDHWLGQVDTVVKVAEAIGTKSLSPSSSSSSRPTMGRGDISSRARSDKATVTPTFAYGLQPYKAVHDAKASIHETLFYVFPSTSGRVVSHQRNDKVELFKRLKEDLERLKSDTLDTGFMRVIHLSAGAQ